MLVLSRRPSEVVQIGDDIFVTVIEIRHDKVRLGIQAPKDVLVLRAELREREQETDNGPSVA